MQTWRYEFDSRDGKRSFEFEAADKDDALRFLQDLALATQGKPEIVNKPLAPDTHKG